MPKEGGGVPRGWSGAAEPAATNGAAEAGGAAKGPGTWTGAGPAVPGAEPDSTGVAAAGTAATETGGGGLRRQLRRLADPSVIGWPLFWLSYAWFVIDSLPSYLRSDSRPPASVWTVVVSATAAQAVTFAILLLAKYTYLRTAMARRHPSWTVLSFAVATFFGGIAARVAEVALQPELVAEPEPDLFNHTVYQTVALCIFGVVVTSLREHRADVARLEGARESLIATRSAGEHALVAEREQVKERVRQLADVLQSTLPRVSASDASAALSHAAGEVIRPLSHELAMTAPDTSTRAVAEVPYPSWWATLRSIASEAPLINPGLMGLTTTLLAARLTVTGAAPEDLPPGGEGVRLSVDLADLLKAVAQLAIVFAAVWLAARVAVWALRRFSLNDGRRAWTATIVATMGIGAVSQLLAGAVFALLGFDLPLVTPAGTVLFVVPLLAVVAVVAAIQTTAARRQAAVAELTRANEDLDWEVHRTNELLWRQRQSLSTWLHGPIQASLNAGAIQLAREGSGQVEIEAALGLFTEACAKPPSASKPPDVAEELAEVRKIWAPLCEVTWSVAPAAAELIGGDPVCASTLTDVIVEGCANAVLHGRASRIEVRLEVEGERVVRLVITNNGSGAPVGGNAGSVAGEAGSPAGGATDGLGTQMLNDVCLSWSRTSGPAGTVLEARFPVSAPLS